MWVQCPLPGCCREQGFCLGLGWGKGLQASDAFACRLLGGCSGLHLPPTQAATQRPSGRTVGPSQALSTHIAQQVTGRLQLVPVVTMVTRLQEGGAALFSPSLPATPAEGSMTLGRVGMSRDLVSFPPPTGLADPAQHRRKVRPYTQRAGRYFSKCSLGSPGPGAGEGRSWLSCSRTLRAVLGHHSLWSRCGPCSHALCSHAVCRASSEAGRRSPDPHIIGAPSGQDTESCTVEAVYERADWAGAAHGPS